MDDGEGEKNDGRFKAGNRAALGGNSKRRMSKDERLALRVQRAVLKDPKAPWTAKQRASELILKYERGTPVSAQAMGTVEQPVEPSAQQSPREDLDLSKLTDDEVGTLERIRSKARRTGLGRPWTPGQSAAVDVVPMLRRLAGPALDYGKLTDAQRTQLRELLGVAGLPEGAELPHTVELSAPIIQPTAPPPVAPAQAEAQPEPVTQVPPPPVIPIRDDVRRAQTASEWSWDAEQLENERTKRRW
jgi:hypothetical protein